MAISYLSELVDIPPGWRAEEALSATRCWRECRRASAHARVDEVIEWMGLGEHRASA